MSARAARIEAFRAAMRSRLEARVNRARPRAGRPPRYDEVWARGTAWLDSLTQSPTVNRPAPE